MSAREALRLARELARSLSAAVAAGFSDAEDIAASAVLRLLSQAHPFSRSAIRTSVQREAWLVRAKRRADSRFFYQWLSLASPAGPEGSTAAAGSGDADAARAATSPGCRCRRFVDGTTAILRESEPCAADLAALEVTLPDGTALRGPEARECAQVALLRERQRGAGPLRTSNALRAANALIRDSALLAVAGLPWREALSRLQSQGIVVSRGALRSGLRAARLRCAGQSAHGRSSV